MKTLVFSDTHLTKKFNQQKFGFLAQQIKKADQVIMLGDLWDGFFISFDDFINSNWRKLFPLMKKKTIYLYGNHDPKVWSDKRVNEFCKKATVDYEFKVGKAIYYCVHGHELLKHVDGYIPFVRNKYFAVFSSTFYNAGSWLLKESFWISALVQNKRLIKYQQKFLSEKVLVTGHTHVQQYIPGSYLNPGVNSYGLLQCAWIDESGVKFVRERY